MLDGLKIMRKLEKVKTMIKDRIVDEYMKMRDAWEEEYLYPNKFQVVIRMKPSTYAEMVVQCHHGDTFMPEFLVSEYRDIMYTRLCGLKTPIILDVELAEEVEFTIQPRDIYERLEKEKLYERFIKMFDE